MVLFADFDLEKGRGIDGPLRSVARDAYVPSLAFREANFQPYRRIAFLTLDGFEILIVQAGGQFVLGHHVIGAILVDDHRIDLFHFAQIDRTPLRERHILGLPIGRADLAIKQNTGRSSVSGGRENIAGQCQAVRALE